LNALIVRVAKKSPVVQPLKMRAKGKVEIQTLPSPKTVATVDGTGISRAVCGASTAGQISSGSARFKIKMGS